MGIIDDIEYYLLVVVIFATLIFGIVMVGKSIIHDSNFSEAKSEGRVIYTTNLVPVVTYEIIPKSD